ncbi:hypothetical protein ISG34_06290 [Methanothermobacter marburgensis]|uniref:Uncharacterized protein n=1 Tax=Methanothermobacter marburgensis (strain ATCC BAA-927 / DSM 2133 / JCM 14651 / NBRC 100331 / OCM 82 / Marburg) TaxID=79929 RepID=D9PXB8_METTM|nr:hypothetical protein [Methanothermobacter marburgensis]ADL58866.1 conserved hypothetical protein [Methanothermobacter marburgensis str. Marburg]WBF09413.1 hypothetical protein ISG34_06290 [Methanothermobacter marburgensis]
MRSDRFMAAGIIFIALAITLFTTDILDPIITPFTHVFLMGSSEGKDVIFFTIMGTMFLLAPLFREGGVFGPQGLDKNTYLYISAIVAFVTYLTGLAVEVAIRLEMGVSPFTTFISMNPAASTSLTHSHVFKASLSPITGLVVPVSSGIHTGSSLAGHIPFLLPVTIISITLIYILGLLSTGDRRDFHVAIVIFATASTIIGVIDGGLFSTPALVGLSGIIGMSALRVPFSPGNLKIPALIIASLVVLRVLLGIMGSVPGYYEVTIIEPSGTPSLEGLHVISEERKGDKLILKLSPEQNEMVLLDRLTRRLDGRCSGFFMTWNFFSFF